MLAMRCALAAIRAAHSSAVPLDTESIEANHRSAVHTGDCIQNQCITKMDWPEDYGTYQCMREEAHGAYLLHTEDLISPATQLAASSYMLPVRSNVNTINSFHHDGVGRALGDDQIQSACRRRGKRHHRSCILCLQHAVPSVTCGSGGSDGCCRLRAEKGRLLQGRLPHVHDYTVPRCWVCS